LNEASLYSKHAAHKFVFNRGSLQMSLHVDYFGVTTISFSISFSNKNVFVFTRDPLIFAILEKTFLASSNRFYEIKNLGVSGIQRTKEIPSDVSAMFAYYKGIQ